MRRILWLIAVNIDVLVALLLSVLFGLLDIMGAVSSTTMNGVIVLTLAALAASMLHNRVKDETGSSQFQIQLDKWLGDEAVKVLNGAETSRELAEARRDIFSAELMVSRRQARQLPLETLDRIELSDRPTAGEARALFEHLGLPLPAEFTDADVAALIEKALHSPDPYVDSSSKYAAATVQKLDRRET